MDELEESERLKLLRAELQKKRDKLIAEEENERKKELIEKVAESLAKVIDVNAKRNITSCGDVQPTNIVEKSTIKQTKQVEIHGPKDDEHLRSEHQIDYHNKLLSKQAQQLNDPDYLSALMVTASIGVTMTVSASKFGLKKIEENFREIQKLAISRKTELELDNKRKLEKIKEKKLIKEL